MDEPVRVVVEVSRGRIVAAYADTPKVKIAIVDTDLEGRDSEHVATLKKGGAQITASLEVTGAVVNKGYVRDVLKEFEA